MFQNYKKILFTIILSLMLNKIMTKEIKMNLNKNKIQNENTVKYNSNKYYSNNNNNNNSSANDKETIASSSPSSSTDITNLTWDCANNSSCIQSIAKNIINNYENGKNINFELFSIEKIKKSKKSSASDDIDDKNINNNNNNNNNNNKKNYYEKDNNMNKDEARSTSTIKEFFKENALDIPIGPMILNVKRSDDDTELMEINLFGKSKMNNDNLAVQEKDLGRRHKVVRNRHKRHLQVVIPMYLAANAFGWTLLAVKAVTLLAIKAILISKLAFLVASSIVLKSFLDNSHKMMYPQHFPPSLTSYSMMDYGIQTGSIPDAVEDQYNSQIIDNAQHVAYNPQQHIIANPNVIAQQHQQQQQELQQQQQQHQQPQQYSGSGTSHHQVVYAIQANTSHPQFYPLTQVSGTGGGNSPHIKRRDQWTGVRRPAIINSISSKGIKAK